MGQSTRRVAIATLFGAVISITKIVVPSPIDKMFIVFHALLLGLGALLIRGMGATYVAVIGGVLTVLWRVALAPFTFLFALLYGLLVDSFFLLFKVNPDEGDVRTARLVASITLSTALVGFLSYYVTVFISGLLQGNLALEISILAIGTLSGAVAGYFTSVIWNKYLKNARF